mgnify:FL=1
MNDCIIGNFDMMLIRKERFLLCPGAKADIINCPNVSMRCGEGRLTRNSVQIRSSPAAVNGDEGALATAFYAGRRA